MEWFLATTRQVRALPRTPPTAMKVYTTVRGSSALYLPETHQLATAVLYCSVPQG